MQLFLTLPVRRKAREWHNLKHICLLFDSVQEQGSNLTPTVVNSIDLVVE